MPDSIASFKLLCVGGLNSNENHLDLSDNDPGAATRLLNYEPSLFGGYRRIEGFSEYDPDYGTVTVAGQTTGDGKVLGIAIFKNDVTSGTTIIAARKDAGAATYSFYYYTANIGWRKFTLDAKTAGELVYQSDVDGMDTQAVADKWISENESTWKPWLE